MATTDSVTTFIDEFNSKYLTLHKSFEDNFWSTKMALDGNSTEDLTRTKQELDIFLRDKANLGSVREKMNSGDATEEQIKVLQVMEKTFKCYIMESEESERLADNVIALEGKLQENRNKMTLGYTNPHTGEFVAGSSVFLRNTMRVNPDEAIRKACFEGLKSIGAFVAEEFVAIVKGRNQVAKKLGYEDFYDFKVTQSEGFGKRQLFEILDGLEEETRPLMLEARARFVKEKGDAALQPYNMGFALAGDVDREQDPYFPFEKAPAVWGKSFAALGISYKGSMMQLDLCDRLHKYSNGFCHWPIAPYQKSDGTWVPAQANFTSLATPSAIGSGATALTTLMHEGGHAAHFANIVQGSPFFSQERAPTSVAYAENQSMFLDALCDDAAWLAKYAKDRDGKVMPFDLVELAIRNKHPYKVFELRRMLSVPYFEKALYELPEDQLTAEKVQQVAEEVAIKTQGGEGTPLMAVPHILSDESSCYYQGYVLAEMSVHQTRAHFFKKYGRIVDNPQVGKDLTEVYWRPGNGASFLDLVKELTGEPLTGSAWVAQLNQDVEQLVQRERQEHAKALAPGTSAEAVLGTDALDMHAVFVHGDHVISDSKSDGGFDHACTKFEAWVNAEFPRK